ncbi:MAG TPA: alpha/beta fold hydrolase [Candidatus Paceibacterota bacterium]|jgi:predicted alpha/beta hydrolase family esterase|nr:alpha/beta fold hydrolase [Candidatus Paceibacterota bacterium]
MTKRVFIVHGWDGAPTDSWFPWLKQELEAKGFEVHVPQLPEPGSPRIYNWVPALAQVVGVADEQTYFVGHSMGCQTTARYLETLPEGQKVGGAVFVAGFFKHLVNLDDDENSKETDKHWLTTPPDLAKVKLHLPKSVAIFSDNDPWVPLDNQDDYRDKLGSEIIIEHEKEHYGNGSGIKEVPVVLEKVLEMAQ